MLSRVARRVLVSAAARPATLAVRAFGAVAKAGAAKATDLASVLKDEMDYEKEEGGASDANLATIAQSLHTASGFKVEDAPGSSRFLLSKTLADGRRVTLDVDCNPISTEKEDYEGEDEAQDEDEEDDGMEEGYRALITIEDASRGGKIMQIGAFVTEQLRIQRVTLYADGKKAPSADQIFSGLEETASYGGPVFDELDDTLQNAFYEWLSDEVGVDDDLAARLSDYASAKEQTEYVGWLKSVHSFVKAK